MSKEDPKAMRKCGIFILSNESVSAVENWLFESYIMVSAKVHGSLLLQNIFLDRKALVKRIGVDKVNELCL